MLHIFQLGDGFLYSLSWLDITSLCRLDIAVGNVSDRSMWRQCLYAIDINGINEIEHCHSSVRWLITRGVGTTRIRMRSPYIKNGKKVFGITDATLLGLGFITEERLNFGGSKYLRLKKESEITGIDCDRKISGSKCDQISRDNSDDLGIARCCLRLESINLHRCDDITDIGLSAIGLGCPHLAYLNLQNCARISDEGLLAIARGCPLLQCINLQNCVRITDVGVSALARCCPDLATINLMCCSEITDFSLSDIAQGCPHLVSINLYHCQRITDEGVSAIALSCPSLVHINLAYCPNITDIGLSALRQGCKDVFLCQS